MPGPGHDRQAVRIPSVRLGEAESRFERRGVAEDPRMRDDSNEAREHDVRGGVRFDAADQLFQPGAIATMVLRVRAEGVDENVDVSETNRSPP